jgi:hypothetical protein
MASIYIAMLVKFVRARKFDFKQGEVVFTARGPAVQLAFQAHAFIGRQQCFQSRVAGQTNKMRQSAFVDIFLPALSSFTLFDALAGHHLRH